MTLSRCGADQLRNAKRQKRAAVAHALRRVRGQGVRGKEGVGGSMPCPLRRGCQSSPVVRCARSARPASGGRTRAPSMVRPGAMHKAEGGLGHPARICPSDRPELTSFCRRPCAPEDRMRRVRQIPERPTALPAPIGAAGGVTRTTGAGGFEPPVSGLTVRRFASSATPQDSRGTA